MRNVSKTNYPSCACNSTVTQLSEIIGEDWWNTKRQEVYQSTNYHCIACGVHKTEAKKHRWLEAHEFWKIDYQTGICEVTSIEPLCHYCHNFIHSGRLSTIAGKEKSIKEVKEILEHGFNILSENKLKCFDFTLRYAKHLNCNTFNVEAEVITVNHNLKWTDWKLLFEGVEYTASV